MQTFGINDQNDIYRTSTGNLAVLKGQDAVETVCENVSLASLGEEVLTTGNGMPFFQDAFTGTPNVASYEAYLLATLSAVQNVISVQNLVVSTVQNISRFNGIREQQISYTATVESAFGTFEISGAAP